MSGSGYWGNEFAFTGFYQWQQPTDWTPNLDWFIGPGAHIGFWNESKQNEYGTGVVIGVDGIIGLEYTLDDIPLNFSVGLGPSIPVHKRTGMVLLERRLCGKVRLLAHIVTPI
ncbi:MAG: hypothetical protein U5L72_05170 [Bacteroidales bacterium]|nr:hypothetical protein [Bacteroidales bacterium]